VSAGASTATGVAPRRLRRPRLVALVAALAGVGVSIYLTIEHYSNSVTLACPESSTINCLKVTTSKWATIAGVPVAVLGLAFFVVMAVLLAVPSQRRELEVLRMVGAAGGLAMVFYLLYIELFKVDAICLWCTAVHLLTAVMFVAVLWEFVATRTPSPR
jgi:uncharacterized membrane protein